MVANDNPLSSSTENAALRYDKLFVSLPGAIFTSCSVSLNTRLLKIFPFLNAVRLVKVLSSVIHLTHSRKTLACGKILTNLDEKYVFVRVLPADFEQRPSFTELEQQYDSDKDARPAGSCKLAILSPDECGSGPAGRVLPMLRCLSSQPVPNGWPIALPE